MRRKIVLPLLGLATVITLCGCSVKETIHRISNYKSPDSMADETLENIFDAMKEQDANAIVQLFSEKAIAEAEGLEKSAEELCTFFQGDVQSIDDRMGPSYRLSKDNKVQMIWPNYDIYTTDGVYRVEFCEYTEENEEPDMLGVWCFYIIKAEVDEDLWRPYSPTDDELPGIHIGVR